MPESAQVIAEIIGREATLKLASKTAHRHVYVPKRIDQAHWIARTVGWAKAYALSQAFGGCLMHLATCGDWWRAKRNAEMRQAYEQGASTLDLAARYDLDRSQVYRIVGASRR